MKRFKGILLALAAISLLVMRAVTGQSYTPVATPMPIIVPTAAPTPTIVPTPSPQDIFKQHLAVLNPSLRKYIRNLYKAYYANGWKYAGWDILHQHIMRVHNIATVQWGITERFDRKDVDQIVYGAYAFSKRWNIDIAWLLSDWDHESGFTDVIGDKINHKTGLVNPDTMWSISIGQVQLDTARGDLKARGVDPTGLTVTDLLYFRLMNMDVAACVLAAKVHHYRSYIAGTEAYNAGDRGWKDGRSDQYYKDVLRIYKRRSTWMPEEKK